jgi:polynucleotide 5'-triphosphatase
MDIAALVNHEEVPPRRSLSGSLARRQSSVSSSSAQLPTPPVTTNNEAEPKTRKRKRGDPKPIWAAREDETFEGLTFRQWQQKREQSRPAPAPQTQAPPQPQPQPGAMQMHNGPPPSNHFGSPGPRAQVLPGYEIPISNDNRVYEDVARKVCDFIYNTVITKEEVRAAIAEAPGQTQVEVEARWGQLIHRATSQRFQSNVVTEGVVNKHNAEDFQFESTMTMPQHKQMNTYLNRQVQMASVDPTRAKIDYKHTKEEDSLYELDRDSFQLLPPNTRILIGMVSKKLQRIRVTRDTKDPSKPPSALIKVRLANMEIASPMTEWDYRIGINLEIKYPGPLDNLKPVVESGRDAEAMKRFKDRVSYSWLDAFQIDLTQVISDGKKNHELEFELNSDVLLANGDKVVRQEMDNAFEALVNGMMNNLRVLSREVTAPVSQ